MNFNNSQQSAILHQDGAMLVLAGPGSGKTAVITERTCNLIEKYGVEPASILVITFTRAAAAEMKERFYRRGGGQGVTFGTFHGLFFTILKNAYGFTGDNIAGDDTRYAYMRDIISHYNLDYKDENEFIGNILAEISLIKNSRIDLNNYYSNLCSEDIFREIYRWYAKKLKENHLIDFDDMQTYTYELFSQRPDILKRWQDRYRYILIDEFQDINKIQYDIIKMLALPENNLFVVGDDDQSIYRFRGSKPEIMLNFKNDFPEAGQVTLSTNYRCSKYIVETSLNLISHNKKRFHKEILADSKEDRPIIFAEFENRRDENVYLLKDIEQRLKEGFLYSEMAVLYRTNNQARSLIEAFMTYNIPFISREKLPNIYEHWIAGDIFSYIKIAQGDRRRKEFLRIANRPKRYISRDSLCDSTVAFDEWIKLYDDKPWMAQRIEKLWYDIKMLAKMTPYSAINYIRKGICYDDFIIEYAEYRNANKADLFEILDDIQNSAKGYKTFEEWTNHIRDYSLELERQARLRNKSENAVLLSTFHGAKGLEFENVYIIDANEGFTPYKKAVMEAEIEEERRLFYVGMTRARKNLSIYSVKNINDRVCDKSRFIEECKHRPENKKMDNL